MPLENVPFATAKEWCGESVLRDAARNEATGEHNPQTFTNWKSRGVPWYIVGPILRTMMGDGVRARCVHDPKRTFVAPEDTVEQPRFSQAWQQVTALWKLR